MKNQGHLKFDLFGLTWIFQDKWVTKQSCTNKNTPHEVVFRPKLLPPRNSQNRSLCQWRVSMQGTVNALIPQCIKCIQTMGSSLGTLSLTPALGCHGTWRPLTVQVVNSCFRWALQFQRSTHNSKQVNLSPIFGGLKYTSGSMRNLLEKS